MGNWLSFFHLGKSHSVSKRKLKRHPSEPNEMKSIALPGWITSAATHPEHTDLHVLNWSIYSTVLTVRSVEMFFLVAVCISEIICAGNICRWKRR